MARKKIYCQHPYELEDDPRMVRLDKVFPDSGYGLFWKIYRRIRLGNGRYPVTALYTELCGNNKRRKQRLFKVLNHFDLFFIDRGMVELREDIIRRRGAVDPKVSLPQLFDPLPL